MGALVTRASFCGSGLTQEQLYLTGSYQEKNLQRIQPTGNKLSRWDFSGQDLTGASLSKSRLTNTTLTGAKIKNADLLDASDLNSDC